jgi:hypothetical protein
MTVTLCAEPASLTPVAVERKRLGDEEKLAA